MKYTFDRKSPFFFSLILPSNARNPSRRMHACTLRLVLLLFFGGFKRLWQQVKVYITTSEAKKEERVVKVILGWVKANAKTIQDRSDAGCSRRPTKNLPKTFFLQCFPLTHALKWTTDEKKTVREFLPAAKPSKYFV